MYKKQLANLVFSSFIINNCNAENSIIINYPKRSSLSILSEENSSNILEINNYSTILSPLNYSANSLLIFDLDDTLFVPFNDSFLGSSSWFYGLVNQEMEKRKVSFIEACDSVYPLFLRTQQNLRIQPIENQVPQLLSALKAKGITIIGLTARRPCAADLTINQLKKIGIELGFLSLKNTFRSKNFIYKGGIIFASENNKGKILNEFLYETKNIISERYNEIVFFDDKLKNVQEVNKELKIFGIKYKGIHYNRLKHSSKL